MTEPNGLIGGHDIAFIANYNRDNSHAALLALGGKFAVFVNDIHAVSMWVAAGGIAAHRVLTPRFNDDDADAHFDPVEYADHVCNELDVATMFLSANLKQNAVAYGGNELFTGLPSRTDPWLAKFTDRCTQRGYKVVVANWAYKNIPPPLPLTAAALRRNGGWMGFHEGTFADAPLAPDAFRDGAIGGFIAWQQANPGIPVWITEFAGSATAHQGWQTLYNGDAKLWAAQIEWAVKNVYQPRNVPLSMFTREWDRGAGWSWNVPALVTEVSRLNRSYVYMTQQPSIPDYSQHDWGTKVEKALVEATANINVRTAPDEAGTKVGQIGEGNIVTYWTKPFPGTKYLWYKVLYDGQERYVAEVAGLTFINPTPPAEKRISWSAKDVADFEAYMTAFLAKGVPSDSGGGF